jgi:hypothetical protein
MDELLPEGIEVIKPFALGPNPQPAESIRLNGSHDVAAQAVGIPWFMAILAKACGSWIKLAETAILCADPDLPTRGLEKGGHNIAAETAWIIWVMPIADEPVVLSVKPAQTPSCCTDPERSIGCLKDSRHSAGAKTIRMIVFIRVESELPAARIPPVEALVCADPEHTFLVLIDRVDGGTLQVAESSCIAGVATDESCRWVEAIQPATLGTDPENAVTILEQGEHIAITEAMGIAGNRPVYSELITVIPVQAILSSKPHESLTVLKYAEY